MKTIQDKKAFVTALLPLLNDLQKSDGTRFIAELKQEITFADLMALSDLELEGLQKLVNSTRSAKKTQKNTNLYDSCIKPNFVITDEIPSDKVKPKIIC